LVADEQADEGGDLVVAGPSGAQLAAEIRTRPFDEPALEGGVHVLVLGYGDELAGGDVGREPVQGVLHARELLVAQEAGGVQHVGMRRRAAQVVLRQAPVEVRGDRQRGQRRRRAGSEAPAPEGGVLLRGRGVCSGRRIGAGRRGRGGGRRSGGRGAV